MSGFEFGSPDDYYTDEKTDPPWYDDEDDAVVEFADGGDALQIRDEENGEAWVKTNFTGEDLLVIKGQMEIPDDY